MSFEILTLRIKPLEPLMLRRSGEFDPSSRGVYTYAYSLSVPMPSTVIGMLISLLAPYTGIDMRNVSSWSNLLNLYSRVLRSLGIAMIRGPYIYHGADDDICMPLRIGKELTLTSYTFVASLLSDAEDLIMRTLNEGFEKLSTDELRKLVDLPKKVKRYAEEARALEIYESWRVGIALVTRSGSGAKTVREGYIYTAVFTSLPMDAEVRFKIVAERSDWVDHLPKVATLGGEQRVVKLEVSRDRDRFDEAVGSTLQSSSPALAVLLSPMPLPENASVRYLGLEDVIGLGFSLAKQRRKPLYRSLLEGSILLLRNVLTEWRDLNTYRLTGLCNATCNEFEILSSIGYASFIPIPVPRGVSS
jgi:CRISPR-associated protein Cmr3